ncbi:hypothetical protein FRC17_001163 [Serendipita sp. 399]|nr:hypothetical protein FRC17_001163 [Serendipita sp. 399]
MGICVSKGEDVALRAHREVEKQLKEVLFTNARQLSMALQAKARRDAQVKILLLGSGDSGKSTVLKQMRLIHQVGFSPQEIESYRQLVFNNLVHGMRLVLESMSIFSLDVEPANSHYVPLIEGAPDLKDGEPFPLYYRGPLQALWEDKGVQRALLRGNEVALPENLKYFYPQLDRFFDPSYRPSDQDILHCRARTTGINETVFRLKTHELHLLDVGGQKSERRKWIHCFEGVTSILFLASLNGYDMSLSEDRDANQMQDAMAIWDSICHSQWFRTTSIILFLNKLDLFSEKILHSDIKAVFPDFDGKPKDVMEGREYFRKRFLRLAQKSSRTREREIYVQFVTPLYVFLHLMSLSFTNATDTALLRVVMAAVEEYVFLYLHRPDLSSRCHLYYTLPLYASFHNPILFSTTLRGNLQVAALI